MKYGKDNTTNRVFQRVKELEEENNHLRREKNQITLLMKQITELQEQNRQILSRNRCSEVIIKELSKICGSTHNSIELLLVDLNQKFEEYRCKVCLLEKTCKQYEELIDQQSRLKEKSLSQSYCSKRQSMDSLNANIKLESQLLDEEQSLLELLEVPFKGEVGLKIDQLGQQILDKLRDFTQKRGCRYKLIAQLIPLKQQLC